MRSLHVIVQDLFQTLSAIEKNIQDLQLESRLAPIDNPDCAELSRLLQFLERNLWIYRSYLQTAYWHPDRITLSRAHQRNTAPKDPESKDGELDPSEYVAAEIDCPEVTFKVCSGCQEPHLAMFIDQKFIGNFSRNFARSYGTTLLGFAATGKLCATYRSQQNS